MKTTLLEPETAGEPVNGTTPKSQANATQRKHRAAVKTRVSRIPIWNKEPWSIFFSLKVGLTLLTLLTIASIIGTLIDPLEKAQALVYYTWWFKLLLLALAVNMSCATVKTILTKTIPLNKPRFQKTPQFYKANEPAAMEEFEGTAEEAGEAFRRKGFKTDVQGDYGYARRGGISRWGAAIAHAGLVIVLLGGFAASWVAKEGYIKLVEGGATQAIWLRGEEGEDPVQHELGFNLTVEDFDTAFFPQTTMPSKFVSTVTASEEGKVLYQGEVEVNNSPQIKGWRLHQTSYEEFPQIKRYLLNVNHETLAAPIEVEVSQGQTRSLPGMPGKAVVLSQTLPLKWWVVENGQESATGSFGGGSGSMRMRIDQFEPDFIMQGPGQIGSRSQEYNNPALKVTLVDEKGMEVSSSWLFGREELRGMSHSGGGAYKMILSDAHEHDGKPHLVVNVFDAETDAPVGEYSVLPGQRVPLGPTGQASASEEETDDAVNGWNVAMVKPVKAYATVLSVTRNPVIPVVYAGCGLMMIGLVLGFFVRRKEVWFWADKAGKRLHVTAIYRHPLKEFDTATVAAMESIKEAKA